MYSIITIISISGLVLVLLVLLVLFRLVAVAEAGAVHADVGEGRRAGLWGWHCLSNATCLSRQES